MNVKKIYFDMDGVLADFDRGVIELCHIEPVPQNEGWEPWMNDHLWGNVRQIDHFYDRLELIRGAREMFDEVYKKYGERCEILTGIPKSRRGVKHSAEDKKAWVKRLLSDKVIVNTVFREQKPDFCTGKDCILIDDLQSNIDEWEAMGGTGILFTGSEDALRKMKDLGIL